MSDVTKPRNEGFVDKPISRIWNEIASDENPYVAERVHLHGYDLGALVSHTSLPAALFLLFRGELPTPEQERLLEALMIAAMSLGPRHAAVRAAQLAGNGKTDPVHIVPIGLATLGGEATRIPDIMKFLVRATRAEPQQTVAKVLAGDTTSIEEVLPGFGRCYGSRDLLLDKLGAALCDMADARGVLAWGQAVSSALACIDAGWTRSGLFAAALLELGFPARVGGVLYQLLCAPSLAVFGLEMHGLPRTAMPFLSDDKYIIGAADEQA